MSKAIAIDVAKDNIRVNSVHPSLTATHLSKDIVTDPVATKHLLGPSLVGRPAKPEEIAAGVLFLASDESAYMTGSELVIDAVNLIQHIHTINGVHLLHMSSLPARRREQ